MSIGSPQHNENFFSMSVHPEQREKMGLVENAAANREDCLYVVSYYFLALEAEHLDQRSVYSLDGSVIRKTDETAW